jgi:hypothetical protein
MPATKAKKGANNNEKRALPASGKAKTTNNTVIPVARTVRTKF